MGPDQAPGYSLRAHLHYAPWRPYFGTLDVQGPAAFERCNVYLLDRRWVRRLGNPRNLGGLSVLNGCQAGTCASNKDS